MLIFSAGSSQYTSLSVSIFNADGSFITEMSSSGHLLSWNALSNSGQQLANGVYFYRLSAYDMHGQLVESTLQPFYLMR